VAALHRTFVGTLKNSRFPGFFVNVGRLVATLGLVVLGGSQWLSAYVAIAAPFRLLTSWSYTEGLFEMDRVRRALLGMCCVGSGSVLKAVPPGAAGADLTPPAEGWVMNPVVEDVAEGGGSDMGVDDVEMQDVER
jgi:hypothetical protein